MPKSKSPGKKHKPKSAARTITCEHCRYEYPADDKRCTVCGYPWPWLSAGNADGDTTPKK